MHANNELQQEIEIPRGHIQQTQARHIEIFHKIFFFLLTADEHFLMPITFSCIHVFQCDRGFCFHEGNDKVKVEH